ncbi:unnamed protein product [Closterium sp. NIES-53]
MFGRTRIRSKSEKLPVRRGRRISVTEVQAVPSRTRHQATHLAPLHPSTARRGRKNEHDPPEHHAQTATRHATAQPPVARGEGPRCHAAQLAIVIIAPEQCITATAVDRKIGQHKNVTGIRLHGTVPTLTCTSRKIFTTRTVGTTPKPEKHYNAWKIFDVHSKETVAARDVIFYERLSLQTYLDNLAANRDLGGSFRGNRAFATPADEADWDEQNVDGASEEAGPLPYCSVPISMDDDNPRESVNAEVYYDFADNGYVTPQPVDTNVSEHIGPNFLPDPEAGDEGTDPEVANLPRYTQSGLQILGLVTAVHGAAPPKEPPTIQQALGGEHREKWRESMDRELKALQDCNTWKVVPIGVARNKTNLTGKWVFRVKTKADGTIDKFKARWVMRGFDQEHGRDFTETFAPVSRHTSLRILLAIAAMKRKKLRQIGVANAFLYAPIDAEIFVERPHGLNADPNQVSQLEKSLYGIKQAPRLWQQHLHARCQSPERTMACH